MADVIHTTDADSSGSGAALGIILGIVLVLALLIGGYFLFFRGAPATAPNTTIIEQDQPAPAPDVNIQQDEQPAPQGDTNIDINPGGGTGTQEPAPTNP